LYYILAIRKNLDGMTNFINFISEEERDEFVELIKGHYSYAKEEDNMPVFHTGIGSASKN
jgi:hypothetical protein